MRKFKITLCNSCESAELWTSENTFMIIQNNGGSAQKCASASTDIFQKSEEMHELVREQNAVDEGRSIKSLSDELPHQDAGIHADQQTV